MREREATLIELEIVQEIETKMFWLHLESCFVKSFLVNQLQAH